MLLPLWGDPAGGERTRNQLLADTDHQLLEFDLQGQGGEEQRKKEEKE